MTQRAEARRGYKALRLTYAFNRPANIFLKLGKQCGIGRIEALAQNVTRGFECNGFRAFEMFGDLVDGLFDPFVIGWLGYGPRRFQARMREQNLFKVILRGYVVAVRPVPSLCLGFYELLVDLGLCPSHMLGEIDEGGKARELGNSTTQFGFRSDFDQRKKPGHDGSDAHRDRIDTDKRSVGLRV